MSIPAFRGTRSAIRAKCLDCCGEQAPEVRRCEVSTCALWVLRAAHLHLDLHEERARVTQAASDRRLRIAS